MTTHTHATQHAYAWRQPAAIYEENAMPDMFQFEPLRFEHIDLSSVCDEELVVDVDINGAAAQLFIQHRVESKEALMTTPFLDVLDLRRLARTLMNAAAEMERAKYEGRF